MDSPVYHIESGRLMAAIDRALALSSAISKLEGLIRDSLLSHDLSFSPPENVAIKCGFVVGERYRVRYVSDVAGLCRFAGLGYWDEIDDGPSTAPQGYLQWLYNVEEWRESNRAYLNDFHRWDLVEYYKPLIESLQYLGIEHLALTADAVVEVARFIEYFNNRLIDETVRDPNALVKTLREDGQEWHGDTWLTEPVSTRVADL